MKKLLRYIPLQLTFFLILGILVAAKITIISLETIGASIFLCFILLVILKKQNNLFVVITWSLFFLLGIASYKITDERKQQHHYTNTIQFNLDSCYTIRLSLYKKLKSSANYYRFKAKIKAIDLKSATGWVIFNMKKADSLSFLQGDDLLVKSNFTSVLAPKNPYQFNYKLYLENQQIYHQLYTSKKDLILIREGRTSLNKLLGKLHQKIKKTLLNKGFSTDELAIASALLLGQKQEISKSILTNYSNAGAIHILAISGLHIGIIMWLLQWLFLPLHKFKRGKKIALVLTLSILWFYAVFVGLSASVVRATTMFTAVAIGIFINQKTSVYQNLLIAIFLLLLCKPRYLFEVGFQLSFLAVFFIVWAQPLFYKTIKFKYWLTDKAWQIVTVSLAAQIGVLPLSLYYFHQFSGLFLITNLFVIPALGIILSVGFITIFLAALGILPDSIAYIFSLFISYLNQITSWVASYSSFIFSDISFSILEVFILYMLIVSVFIWLQHKHFLALVIAMLTLFSFQINNIFNKYNAENTKEWIVFNVYKASLIAEKRGNKLFVFSKTNSIKSSFITNYARGKRVKKQIYSPNKLVYKYKKDIILVINEKGIYNYTKKSTILLLQNSPKVNLERVLLKLRPKLIIADGSNYKSNIALWKRICKKQKTPFYDTSQKGAYVLR